MHKSTGNRARIKSNGVLNRRFLLIAVGLIFIAAIVRIVLEASGGLREARHEGGEQASSNSTAEFDFERQKSIDISGFGLITTQIKNWHADASLAEVKENWREPGMKYLQKLHQRSANGNLSDEATVGTSILQAMCWNYEGKPEQAYDVLATARERAQLDVTLSKKWLYQLIVFQGICALRRGENENCIMCRGESSCILPISPAAVHANTQGSRLAIEHFTEYLEKFPDDLEVRWLLNLAHMTLGEHPAKVEPRFLISLDRWENSKLGIGKFRDVGHLVGVNRFNQSGGAILDDFDNDGLLDLVVSTFDPTQAMAVYHNQGNGRFEERSEQAGVLDQLGGGLYCVQADYNNDGRLDVFIPRGAWIGAPVRPTLLRNDGSGRFSDITEEAGLLVPVNSNSAAWGDFDNDGWLDLYVCCERQPCRLYRNLGNGTFDDVAEEAGVQQDSQTFCKGATWLDYDNDDDLDLFVNNMQGAGGRLFQNLGSGRFTDVSESLGIDGPQGGFSCWAWDYDNDGWLDLFATSYDRSLRDVVLGLMGKPHGRKSNKLFRNLDGKGFNDVSKEAGLDMVFATMGSNFGDLDNDGFLDIYLGTGDPNISTLVPNRMFKNVAGRSFTEISASTGTGHLQKGHAVSFADWDRDGDLDVFIQMGGAIPGDRYHNILFQNPGQGNYWLSVKLVGKKTNRSAIGARIKLVTAEEQPQTMYRHVSTGSSFGANPLEQHLGLGKAKQIATLEIHWPTSGTTQVFHDITADQAIEITEFAEDYQKREYHPIPLPKE